MKTTTSLRLIRRGGSWWIAASPPHFDEDMGPYAAKKDAESDLKGVKATINSPAWQEMIEGDEDNNEEGWE